jgi:hypothetical protein
MKNDAPIFNAMLSPRYDENAGECIMYILSPECIINNIKVCMTFLYSFAPPNF